MEEIKVSDKISEIDKATDKALTYIMIVFIAGTILSCTIPYLCQLLFDISPYVGGASVIVSCICCYIAIGKWHSNKLRNLK